MNVTDRHILILKTIAASGRATIAELSSRLHVSEMTIRRDLDTLEQEGSLRRVHGGAVRASSSSFEPPFSVRMRENAEAKLRIAQAISESISDGETVLLDGGSTGLAIAEALVTRELTVCTLSLRAATVLAASSSINLLLPGGFVRRNELSFIGPPVLRTLQDYRFDVFVLTTSGITARAGLTEWNVEDAAVKRAGIDVAERKVVACDASKFGQVAFGRVCDLDQLDLIVSDANLAQNERTTIAAAGGLLKIA